MNKDFQEMVERRKLHMYLCEKCAETFKDEDTPMCTSCFKRLKNLKEEGAF